MINKTFHFILIFRNAKWLNSNHQFFQINLASTFEKIHESARAISESTPPEIRQVVDEIVEGIIKINR